MNPLSAAPIHLANSGDLFWLARSASGGEDAFMRNDQVIVQEGKLVKDHLVTEVGVTDDAFHVSPDGRFFVGRIELEGIGDSLVFVDFGAAVPLLGCRGNPGRLRKAGGEARVGARLRLELDGGRTLGDLPVLAIGTCTIRSGSGCGIPTRAGEILVDPARLLATLVGSPWTGAPISIDIDIPRVIGLVGRELFVQGAFWNTGSSPARPSSLTNGLRLELGAP